MLIKFKITITGKSPLIMHNGRLADVMDPATKEVGEAYKAWRADPTDANYTALAEAEFYGSMYHTDQAGVGPYWPSDNLHTALKNAGAKRKKGRGNLKRPVAGGVTFLSEINPLSYGPGAPRKSSELWADGRYRFTKMARVQSAKVARTRARFRGWSFEVTGTLDDEVIDLAELQAVADIAGRVIGLGDWRPEKTGTYGKFTAKVQSLGEYDPLTDEG